MDSPHTDPPNGAVPPDDEIREAVDTLASGVAVLSTQVTGLHGRFDEERFWRTQMLKGRRADRRLLIAAVALAAAVLLLGGAIRYTQNANRDALTRQFDRTVAAKDAEMADRDNQIKSLHTQVTNQAKAISELVQGVEDADKTLEAHGIVPPPLAVTVPPG